MTRNSRTETKKEAEGEEIVHHRNGRTASFAGHEAASLFALSLQLLMLLSILCITLAIMGACEEIPPMGSLY